MIRDLAVNLATGPERDPAAEFAVSIAEAFGAHLTGIAFSYDPSATPVVIDGMSAAWIDTRRAENRAAAQRAVDRFEDDAGRHGVPAAHRVIETGIGAAPNQFAHIVREFDLAVVTQTARDFALPDDLLIEAALFGSGRPTVVVPHIHTAPLTLDHVVVCWDHGRNAARAVHDALPFLARAGRVEIVTVDHHDRREIAGAGLAGHLARHDIAAEVRELGGSGADVSGAILSHAADSGADFLVMGGYGHSRLRHFVLGGTTRGMLQSMTVPVLMAH